MTIQKLIEHLSKYDLDIKVQLLINTQQGMQCVDVAEPVLTKIVKYDPLSDVIPCEDICIIRKVDD